jgi:cobalt-zinc-cadmium resistance protein CzcA
MIGALIDFALRNRLLVLGASVVLFLWGVVSFHNLPIEAYPDVADTYVQIVTQWPGHAAEEVEQQITVPLEVSLNGVAHMTHLRSVSLAGLSAITIICDDETTTFNARQEVLDRVERATLPSNVNPSLGPDYSPTGQIMFYTLKSANPNYDVMELKTLNDWRVRNQLKSVPNVVEVNIFGGPTREYQVQVDPGKLVSYGLSLSQVEQALAANNTNAGGGFIERGQQALNIRAVGLMATTDDIGATVVRVLNGTPVRVRDVAAVVQAPKVRLGQLGKAIRREDGTVLDDDDVVEGIVLLRKGAEADATLEALHAKIAQLNNGMLPPGVKLITHLDRSDLVHYTTRTVLRNLTDGVLLVTLILFLFLGNVRSALIVTITIPFSLLFAAILLDLNHIPANLLSLGALDFGMVVDGSVVMVENILRHTEYLGRRTLLPRNDFDRRPRSPEARVLRSHHHHRRLFADLHPAARGGSTVPPDGLDRRFCAAGRSLVRLGDCPRALQFAVQGHHQGMEESRPRAAESPLPRHPGLVFRPPEVHSGHGFGDGRHHAVAGFRRSCGIGVSAPPG